jgi:hypothetical protein
VISKTETLALKYFYAIAPSVQQFFGGGAFTAEPPGASALSTSGANNFGATLTSTFSNSLVNQVHYADNYSRAQLATQWPVTAADLGMTPASTFNPLTPAFAISSPGFGFGGQSIDTNLSPQTNYQWQDQISWNHGRHLLRVGYDGSYLNWLACSCGKSRGSLTFQTFSDFLLGESAAQNGGLVSNVFASSASLQPFSSPNMVRMNNQALFVQEDFKLNSRLTLNLGVRWEYLGWPHDINPQGGTNAEWSLLQAVAIPPAAGTYVGFSVASDYTGPLPAGVIRRTTNSLTATHAPLDDFMPRIGFAWQPLGSSGRFVVRGGYGWFYDTTTGQHWLDSLDGEPPLSAPLSRSSAANAIATLAVPFNPPVSSGSFTPFLRTPTSAISLTSMDPNLTTPLSYSWNLGIQYAFTPSWVLDVTYAGSRSEHIEGGSFFDVPQLASVSAPLNCGAPFGCVTTNTVSNASERLPVLGFSPGGLHVGGNWGDAEYNALEVTVKKTFSHGLQMQAAYTYDKCMANLQGTGGATGEGTSYHGQGATLSYNVGLDDPGAGRGECSYDRPQRLIVNYLYSFPDYNHGAGIGGKLLSGWGVSGVTTLQSGNPMTFSDARNGTVYGSVGTAAAQLCPGETIADIIASGSVVSRIGNGNQYFNPSAFCVAPVVGGGNGTGYGNLGSNVLLGPGQFDWDISLKKSTAVGGIHEGAILEFRAEFFNAFNHPQFSNPNTVVSSSSFGSITSEVVGPRIVQFALKYLF